MCFQLVPGIGEDVLSMDIAYIDSEWEYCVKNVGLIHCKQGTSGEEVAKVVLPALNRHGLVSKVYAYVKDQGSNLKTTARALSNAFNPDEMRVGCPAIGLSSPYSGRCGLRFCCSHSCTASLVPDVC